ncbi:MAG: site-specific DNA-methyltransferase [Cyclobacteriaceae bacterium]
MEKKYNMSTPIEKLDLQSPDLVNDNFEKLAELFPNCVTESADGKAIDFDLLKQELSHAVVEGNKERYRLEWPGKREAIVTANLPTTKTLRPVREDSVDFDNTENLYIEGDNLEVLKLLQESYLGKVKMIYIDPPYNTGNDFVYRDNFDQESEEYSQESGQKDELRNRLVVNPELSGRFHSNWLSMIYPRIKLARNLLSDDGVIAVSIGTDEIKNTISILEEIFGEENYISIITWEQGRKNDSTFFSESVDYVVFFAKNKQLLAKQGVWREKKDGVESILDHFNKLKAKHEGDYELIESKMKEFYSGLSNSDARKKLKHFYRADERGLFFGADISSASTSIPDYEIYHPVTKKPVKKPSRGWGATEPVMLKKIEENRVLFGTDETTIPLKKSYLYEVDSIVKTPVIYKDGRAASRVILDLFGKAVFNNPKDHFVLSEFIEYATNSKDDFIVIDFFGGSSSTAHATLHLNSTDSGKRKFIVIQLPEPTDAKSLANKEGFHNIAEIGKERIRRAAKKIKEETQADIDYGFRVYRLDESNMQDVYYKPQDYSQDNLKLFEDNVKPDRTPDDLLAQIMLDWGLPLSLKVEQVTISGKKLFKVAGNSLYACFDQGIDEEFAKEIAADTPLRIVFRDSGFKNDTAKTNVKQLLKQLSPETEMKVI